MTKESAILSRWRLDGVALRLRLMRAEDAAAVKQALERLSPEARRHRFFSAISEFSDDLVRRLTDVDPTREYAIVAVHDEGGQEIPIAGGRFVHGEEPGTCEFSLTVGDSWQGRGIGRRMLRVLIAEAQRRGLRTMTGHILAENRPMLGLARRLGFVVGSHPQAPEVRLVSLDLDSAPRRRAPGLLALLFTWAIRTR